MKKILYVLRPSLSSLTPVISQLVALSEIRGGGGIHFLTTVINKKEYDILKKLNIEVKTVVKNESDYNVGKVERALRTLKFRKLLKRTLKDSSYDIIWIGSVDTLNYCNDIVRNYSNIILNIYELYDGHQKILKRIKSVAQKAKAIIVPEYNRAHILKVWLRLEKLPLILPNKPYYKEEKISAETKIIVDKIKEENKKVILYQGWISASRDVKNIAKAISEMEERDNYRLVLMGNVVKQYDINQLLNDYSFIRVVPFVSPPQHLFVTQTAHIGIAVYSYSCLNTIFCAPNKTYEYAYSGVPILAMDIPGLENSVGASGCGVCVNFDDSNAIKSAIRELDSNHDKYVKALMPFYNEFDIKDVLSKAIECCE